MRTRTVNSLQEGEAWKRAHKTAVATLRGSQDKLPVVARHVDRFCRQLLGSGQRSSVSVHDLSGALRRLTMDVILEVVIGWVEEGGLAAATAVVEVSGGQRPAATNGSGGRIENFRWAVIQSQR